MPKITASVDLEDLKKKKNLKRFSHIKDRIQAIILSAEKLTAQEIADKLDRSRGFVTKWVARFNEGGLDALEDLYRPGQPQKITLTAEKTLLKMVASGPPSDAALARFRLEDFKKALSQKHKIEVSVRTVGRFLEKKNKLYNASPQT